MLNTVKNLFSNNTLNERQELEREHNTTQVWKDLWKIHKLHCINEFIDGLYNVSEDKFYKIEKDIITKFVNSECLRPCIPYVENLNKNEGGYVFRLNGNHYMECKDLDDNSATPYLKYEIFTQYDSFNEIFDKMLIDWHSQYKNRNVIEGGLYLSTYYGMTVIDFKSIDCIRENYKYETGAIQYKIFFNSGETVKVMDNVDIVGLFLKYKEFQSKKQNNLI